LRHCRRSSRKPFAAYAPVLDKLLQEVGLSQSGLSGLVSAVQTTIMPAPIVSPETPAA